MLHLERVTKTHVDGDRTINVLLEVNLTVASGESVVIMGPSGSGKTSLANVASGIELPTFGRALLGDIDLGRATASARAKLRRRKVGIVFQDHELDPMLTALENVELPLQLDGERNADARGAAMLALQQCSIGDLHDRRPSQLSGGQRQCVAVARAIVGEHRQLIVADEPTAALDTAAARSIVELLMRFATQGLAVLMTTHDSRLATYADRVVTLRDGAIVNAGTELST